ncbi:hypothetical protein DYB28_014026 [Aphanomyces astaci]|uniref:DDE-1 domain-containing protein n=1 Tax=Aphanomyces astaci TaxID=112090 RepID=A0A9X8ECX3_APHAT|nr:hypothetical protein DYB28_014026 [Aphanomyces astaci]
MITWIKINQRAWLMSYLSTKKSDVAYDSLLRLLRRFCQRYGFSRQRQTKNKLKQAVLTEVHDEFARDFHREYQSYENDCVFNVDETGMYYNLPPTYIWAVRGGSAKISTGEKHSIRMTAALTARADGQKLSLLLIMKGVSGACIETNEFPTFPRGHHYAMQENAWIDAVVWKQYLYDVLGESIEEPSVGLMDNFECHVSDVSYKIMHEERGSHLCALPPCATSVCQPLDVGVMAPFKRNLRNLWLYEEQLEGDDDEDPYSPTARQKRMAMVLRSISAWDMITADVIRQAFAKALRVN